LKWPRKTVASKIAPQSVAAVSIVALHKAHPRVDIDSALSWFVTYSVHPIALPSDISVIETAVEWWYPTSRRLEWLIIWRMWTKALNLEREMTGLHCNYDTEKYAAAYSATPDHIKDQMEALRQKIVRHLKIKNDIENRLRAIRAYEAEKARKERNGYAAVIAAVVGIAFLSTKITKGVSGKILSKTTKKTTEEISDSARDKVREVAVDEIGGDSYGSKINFLIDALTAGNFAGALLSASKPATIATSAKEWSLGLDNENDIISGLVSQMLRILDLYYPLNLVKQQCAILNINSQGPSLRRN